MSWLNWFTSKTTAAPAPSPEPVLPFCCPHCGSPHGVEVALLRHRYPGEGSDIRRVDKGDMVACGLCGTVYAVTNRGVEERKQRQPDAPQQPSPGPPSPADLNSRVKELRWKRPKV